MRMFFSRRRWMSVGIMCLSAGSMIGCRSPGASPGMGWFGWMNPKPSTALASNPPTKPSVAMLPTPSATTGANAQTQTPSSGSAPLGAYAAANAGAHNHSHTHSHATSATPSSYSTGPYGMASGSTGAVGGAGGATAHTHTQPAGSYAGSGAQSASSGPSYGGYQPPYGNPVARTAELKSQYGAPDPAAARPGMPSLPPNVSAQQNAGAQMSNGLNAYSRTAPYGAPAGTPASYNDYATPGNPGAAIPEPAVGGAANWTPPASAGGNYLDRFNAGGAAATTATAPAAAAPRRDSGAYQPGSTSRNGGNFPVTPASTAVQPASQPAVGASYPSTAYPSTAYPSMDVKANANGAVAPPASPYSSSAPLLR